MIKDIERIGAKLQGHTLGDLRVLLAGDIDVRKTRPKIRAAGHGSQPRKDDRSGRTRLRRWILEAASGSCGKRGSNWAYRRLNKRHVGSSRLLNLLDRRRSHQ